MITGYLPAEAIPKIKFKNAVIFALAELGVALVYLLAFAGLLLALLYLPFVKVDLELLVVFEGLGFFLSAGEVARENVDFAVFAAYD